MDKFAIRKRVKRLKELNDFESKTDTPAIREGPSVVLQNTWIGPILFSCQCRADSQTTAAEPARWGECIRILSRKFPEGKPSEPTTLNNRPVFHSSYVYTYWSKAIQTRKNEVGFRETSKSVWPS